MAATACPSPKSRPPSPTTGAEAQVYNHTSVWIAAPFTVYQVK